MSAVNSAPLSGLALALVQNKLLLEADASLIQGQANTAGHPFIQQLIASKKLSAKQIAEFASSHFGYPLLNLDTLEESHLPPKTLDGKLMQSRRIAPLFKRGNKLFVAISDPTNQQALDDARFQMGQLIEPIIVEDDKLLKFIVKLVEATGATFAASLSSEDDLNLDIAAEGENKPEEDTNDSSGIDVDDAPVVKYIQKILKDAISGGASDIHFEPYEKFYRIRFRTDGILAEVNQPPLVLKEKIAARIKVISGMDISEKRVPQDGRMRLRLSPTRAIDFRVSSLPTLFGEKIVMRILDPSSATLGIEALGYEPEQQKALLDAVNRPYGMVLVTGPTGSGKTVSLYTCLNILNKPGINIATAEDPCEINLAGINQCNVNEKAGLTFAAALKAFLRQDPDIIMVGEIRDLETADISIKAASTGHLVLSTLHTNDAPTTLTRLLNMGVAPYNIASSVILITAQRLARRLCKECKQPTDIPHEALLQAGFTEQELDGSWRPYKAVGCDVCKGSGYKGRVGIYQVMPITDEIQRVIMTGGNAIDIADQAQRDGIRDLRQSGLLKVKQGLTSLEEVESVTNE